MLAPSLDGDAHTVVYVTTNQHPDGMASQKEPRIKLKHWLLAQGARAKQL